VSKAVEAWNNVMANVDYLIQNANHRYYLEKLVVELTQMELDENAGNLQGAFRHKVMAETYKGIIEKAFGITE
jgi:hypothetical protein